MTIYDFILRLQWEELPTAVQNQARRCLLDTLGAAVSGRQTELSRIIHDFAAAAFGGNVSLLWQDGRTTSPPGAALANGMTIDSLDIHDGYNLAKGHAGAAVVPAALAVLPLARSAVSGSALLTTIAIGYEISLRAGTLLHATACDYHTSGAWNAIGSAAIAARLLGLTDEQARHALGTAEYYGPRSQMMRCIDYPTMVKDGSGWGAMTGVSAAMLAAAAFTGAPAITVEAAAAGPHASTVRTGWADLGERWLMLEQYFKPAAVCRWAQPAIQAALGLKEAHGLTAADIAHIRIFTFHEGVRLAVRQPATTEEAQYSLPFPVAAALVHGQLGGAELSGAALQDERVLRLARSMELVETAAYNDAFPARRQAHVEIILHDGRILRSETAEPQWDAAAPPSDDDLRAKFCWLAQPTLGERRTAALETAVWQAASLHNASKIVDLLAPPELAFRREG